LVAPEIDPSSALAGLSLLAGGLLVLRGRRIKATDA
jgi:LPXTG-motif cell wall-anchored protein